MVCKKSAGDFPTVLFEVISKRSSVVEGTMTIGELNDILDELCKDIGKQYAPYKRWSLHFL